MHGEAQTGGPGADTAFCSEGNTQEKGDASSSVIPIEEVEDFCRPIPQVWRQTHNGFPDYPLLIPVCPLSPEASPGVWKERQVCMRQKQGRDVVVLEALRLGEFKVGHSPHHMHHMLSYVVAQLAHPRPH